MLSGLSFCQSSDLPVLTSLSAAILLPSHLQSLPFLGQHRKGELIAPAAIEPETLSHISKLCQMMQRFDRRD